MTGRVRDFWTWLVGDLTPHRTDVCARLKALPPIPEAHRMRITRTVQRVPKNIAEWKRRYVA